MDNGMMLAAAFGLATWFVLEVAYYLNNASKED
jgi:hypothetical protein